MQGQGGSPEPEALGKAFRWLDDAGFQATSALPLFAARHWSPAMERRANLRYRRGLDNVEEVAVPRWYWRRLPRPLGELFEALTLSRGRAESTHLTPLLDPEGNPRWRLVNRFSRYILHSRPEAEGDSLVYFGDDTLFLMEGARRLLSAQEASQRVLDLCCGGGGVGLSLPIFAGELVGVDINQAALDLARIVAGAQGLEHYAYVHGDAGSVLDQKFDLVVGNPPTLPPDLGGRATLYATGSSSEFLTLLDRLVSALTPTGRALLTVFSTAMGRGERAADPLRAELTTLLGSSRGYSYTVRRQFPLAEGRWLRHVALELNPVDAARGETFRDPASRGIQLPGLNWRRDP